MNIRYIMILIVSLGLSAEISASPYRIKEIIPKYKDQELAALWDSFDNIHNPTVSDYEKMKHYLKKGRRPYLDILFNFAFQHNLISTGPRTSESYEIGDQFYNRVLQNINFIPPDNAQPQSIRMITLGNSLTDKSQCIVFYASYNNDPMYNTQFDQRLFKIIQELKEEGYKGHVIYRIGGYPLINRGSLRLAHVPYSFKVLSLIEASQLGYDQVLWLDCSVHPTNSLTEVFHTLQKNGVYLLENGINLDYDYNFHILPDAAVTASGVSIDTLANIPHTVATIVGVSFKSKIGHKFISEWYRLTSMVTPAMSLYPEEYLISIASWRTKCQAAGHIGNFMDVRSYIKDKPQNGQKPFWFDKA